MPSVFILGAGLMQRPAIEAAHKLGYTAIVADGNPKAPCALLADTFVNIDLKDRTALLDCARTFGDDLKAVFTAGTDFSASVSYVAENLGLKSHPFEAALNASDKIRMRRAFSKNGVPSPAFTEITADDWKAICADCYAVQSPDAESAVASKLLQKAGSYSFPLVIKPVDNMGGRGCRMISSEDELASAVSDALQYSRSGRAVLEDYMEGPEFSIDALVFNGEVTITGFADRHIFFPPYFIEMGHTMPTDISDDDWNALASCFASGIRALGLTHGVAKADIKLTPDGPMIGEIAARLSGGYMSGWTYPYASDVFLTEQALLLALDKEPAEVMMLRKKTDVPGVWTVPAVRTSAERAWLSIPGTIKDVLGLEEAARIPFVRDVLPRVSCGDKVTFPVNNVGKCGNIITQAPSRREAAEAAEAAVSSIVVRLEKDNAETDAFLASPLPTVFPPSAYQLPESVFSEISAIASDASFTITSDSVPAVLKSYEDVPDWNKRTVRQALSQLHGICGDCTVPERQFVASFVRGGLQGALYFIDGEAGK